MAYEIEIKAYVFDLDTLLININKHQILSKKKALYFDKYFDICNKFKNEEKELRLRLIKSDNKKECILTYKSSQFDEETKSKQEYETIISDLKQTEKILNALGYKENISFTKECQLFEILYNEEVINIAIVKIPELTSIFIEVEILKPIKDNYIQSINLLKHFLQELGIMEKDFTNKYYTEMLEILKPF